MAFKKFVIKHFHECVNELPEKECSPELKKMLRNENHARFNYFIENLNKELQQVQAARVKKGKKPATLENLKWLVKEMTKVFVISIETEARRMAESDLAKIKREMEAQKINDMESTLAGKPVNEFAEMGVVFNEEKLGPTRDEALEETQKG